MINSFNKIKVPIKIKLYFIVFELRCAVQNYAWGKPGQSSAVAQLAASADKHFLIDDNKPYAEVIVVRNVNRLNISYQKLTLRSDVFV